MKTINDAIRVLEENKIEYKVLNVKTDEYTVDAHVKDLGIKYKEGLSTLLFKNENNQIIVFLRRDDRNIDLNKLCKESNSKVLNICDEGDLTRYGFQKLLLSPILLPKKSEADIKVFVDECVMECEKVVCGSTDKKQCFLINIKDLLALIGDYQIIDATVPNPKRQDSPTIKSVVSGITPSGNAMHIGNYFGAVKPNIDLQNTLDRAFYFIADIHGLTTVKNAKVLEDNIINIILDYLALGLDPKKSMFFRQSDIAAHAYLNTILANYISYGHMKRMHAFKDKLQKGADVDSINMGLFNYPILMAADILLYKPEGVPVGEDQRQHVELTRDIAESFNNAVGKDILKLPVAIIGEDTGRIIGTDGQRKMSKSLGNIIGIFDDYSLIEKQIMGAYTDPNRIKATDPGKVEGNTVFMYHDLINDNLEEVKELKERYKAGTVGDVEVKKKLIEAHKRRFAAAREKRVELSADLDIVRDILEDGAERANIFADETLDEVLKAVGLKNSLNK
jgi:tryptophanyl-tRNA synthetase